MHFLEFVSGVLLAAVLLNMAWQHFLKRTGG